MKNLVSFTDMLDGLMEMASEEANKLVHTVIDVLHERRKTLCSDISLNAFARQALLDASMLSRAETKQRIPSLAFFLDWCEALDTTIEDVVREARSKQ